MKKDTATTIEAMKTALLRELGDEVDLIFQYGSHVRGKTHKYSDVDVSFVPAQDTTWKSITVMVDETLYDLYPIHWSHLERMADFKDLSSKVLLENRILYQRTEAAAERFRGLGERLQACLRPEARPEMIRNALETFQGTGYSYYLLRQQAEAGHQLGCLQHAQSILQTVLHCLAVCNQACIDTRKLEQVLALPILPAGLATTLESLISALEPPAVLAACERLLQTTRHLLFAEQRQVLRLETTFPAVFNSAYPELKRDLQAMMLACEQKDLLSLKGSLISLYHELSYGISRVSSGIEFSGFNTLAEYEQDLTALGFPALLPHLVTGDYDRLQQQCLAFDRQLKKFLSEREAKLNAFATLEELNTYLGTTAAQI
jgi:predicted nucleotidyltransferase